MFFFALLFLDNLIISNGIENITCSGAILFNQYYRKDLLFGSLNQPMNLAINKFTNELFFSHVNWSEPSFRVRVCHLYNKTCTDINEVIKDGRAVAYDRIGKGVFFGGYNGIYKYIRLTKSATKVRNMSSPVWRIFAQKNFYIIQNKTLFVLKKNSSFVKVPEVKGVEIQDFFVSKDIAIYFSNTSGLYKVDRPGKPIYLLSNKLKVMQITEDYENGGVFFATNDGIYMDFASKRTVKRVSDIKRAFGIAFWNVNSKWKKRQLIYSDNHGIYALRASNHRDQLRKGGGSDSSSSSIDFHSPLLDIGFSLELGIIMYLLLVLILMLRTLLALNLEPVLCDGVVFDRKYYEKQMLFGTLNAPRNLVMHMYTGEIFFSHTVHKGTKPDFVIRVCDVDKRVCKDLKEVAGGVAIGYDRTHHDVYFGGRDGIYKYDRVKQTARYLAARGRQILHLFIKNHFYYIENDSKKLLVYKKNRFVPVEEFKNIKMDKIFISKHNSVFFSNKTALYKCGKINKTANAIHSSVSIRQIVQRYNSSKIYFTASDGIYYVHDAPTHQARFKKAADIHQVFGMTFRNTTQSKYEPIQIIYSDSNAIYKLTPSRNSDMCLKERKKALREIARQGMRK